MIHDLLGSGTFDLRELDRAGFRDWLARHLAAWRSDPVFAQRARIRDLRLAHPELGELERERGRARLEYSNSAGFQQLEAASRELSGVEKGVEGLSRAVTHEPDPAERLRLSSKLEEFRGRLQSLTAYRQQLLASNPERLALDEVTDRLSAARERLGFLREVAVLNDLQRQRGRSSGRSGSAFERAAMAEVKREIVPELQSRHSGKSMAVLSHVTLGAARIELDELVVLRAPDPQTSVDVLAIVEAKRNPNDLAHGLRRRLEDIAWLTGTREAYDAEHYLTATFRTGHFDAPATHREAGVTYRFDPSSFRRFLPDVASDDILPSHLYLVTRPDTLWGIGSAGLSRIAHRVATDERFDLDDEEYLGELLEWGKTLTHPIEAPDVLRRYAADPARARHILFLDPSSSD